MISQSGETRDLDIATSICRDFSSNRKHILKVNPVILNNNDPKYTLLGNDKNIINQKVYGYTHKFCGSTRKK